MAKKRRFHRRLKFAHTLSHREANILRIIITPLLLLASHNLWAGTISLPTTLTSVQVIPPLVDLANPPANWTWSAQQGFDQSWDIIVSGSQVAGTQGYLLFPNAQVSGTWDGGWYNNGAERVGGYSELSINGQWISATSYAPSAGCGFSSCFVPFLYGTPFTLTIHAWSVAGYTYDPLAAYNGIKQSSANKVAATASVILGQPVVVTNRSLAPGSFDNTAILTAASPLLLSTQITATPEPAAYTLVAVGLLCGLIRRRSPDRPNAQPSAPGA